MKAPTTTSAPLKPVESPLPPVDDGAKAQAETVSRGEQNATGQPDFTGTSYGLPEVDKYTHGGSAPESLKPVASPSAVSTVGATDPNLLGVIEGAEKSKD